jgi:mRNA interferase RelE/StbE
MASFSISFKPSVNKDLRRLPKSLVPRVMEKIEDLKSEPVPPQAVKIPVADRLYRLRVGDYRIVYEVEVKKKIITIHYVRNRSVVYRDL